LLRSISGKQNRRRNPLLSRRGGGALIPDYIAIAPNEKIDMHADLFLDAGESRIVAGLLSLPCRWNP